MKKPENIEIALSNVDFAVGDLTFEKKMVFDIVKLVRSKSGKLLEEKPLLQIKFESLVESLDYLVLVFRNAIELPPCAKTALRYSGGLVSNAN